MRAKLAAVRKEMGLSQEMAADKVHISRSHYSQIESGDKTPSLDVALRIKQVFDYSDDDIFLNISAPKQGNENVSQQHSNPE